MADPMPDSGEQRAADLTFLAATRALLTQSPGPDSTTLGELQARCHALAADPDPVVAEAAAIVELRVLGAILTLQAAELRSLAVGLTRLAYWLPSARVEQN